MKKQEESWMLVCHVKMYFLLSQGGRVHIESSIGKMIRAWAKSNKFENIEYYFYHKKKAYEERFLEVENKHQGI